MTNIIKISTLFCRLFALILSYSLCIRSASNHLLLEDKSRSNSAFLTKQKHRLLVSGYCKKYSLSFVPKEIEVLLTNFTYRNLLEYKNEKKLPEDLSERDLSGYDFTGCQFTYTNLTDSNLRNIILTNTTCRYIKTYYANKKKRKKQCTDSRLQYYLKNIARDIRSIGVVYAHLKRNEEKADLLLIACGLSRFPLYEDDLYIKVIYWSCAWLHWIKTSGRKYSDIKQYCTLDIDPPVSWATRYPPSKMDLHYNTSYVNFHEYLTSIQAPHQDFDEYLAHFNSGFESYIKNKDANYFIYYSSAEQKIESIKGLRIVYDTVQKEAVKQEACNIAYALSESYKIPECLFNFHRFFYENRIVRLKHLIQEKKYHDTIGWWKWTY